MAARERGAGVEDASSARDTSPAQCVFHFLFEVSCFNHCAPVNVIVERLRISFVLFICLPDLLVSFSTLRKCSVVAIFLRLKIA